MMTRVCPGKMKISFITVFALGALFCAQKVSAQATLYNNGAFIASPGLDISSFAVADDFSFSSTQIIDAGRVWLLDSTLPNISLVTFSGTLSWFIYANNAGKPGTIINSGTVNSGTGLTQTDTGIDYLWLGGPAGSRVFQIDFPVTSTTLTAGTYWFRVKENGINDVSDGSLIGWLGSGSSTGFNIKVDSDEANPTAWNFGVFPQDRAFQLLGASTAAPEPGTLSLLAIGGMGFAPQVCRRKR